MEINNNLEQQRTVKFYVDYRIKKPKRKMTVEQFSNSKHQNILTENLLVNAKIDFEEKERLLLL